MTVAGVHVRRPGKRIEATIVVIADDTVVDHTVLLASAGEDETRQLHQLYVRSTEIFTANTVDTIVLWPPDAGPGNGKPSVLLPTGRAEGAILGAAGVVPSVTRSVAVAGATIRSACGTKGIKINDAVAALSGELSDVPSILSVQRATAAVVAWRVKQR